MKKNQIQLEEILIDKPGGENLLEVPLLDNVFKILLLAVIVLGLVVIGRLLFLGVIRHEFYSSRALANMSDFQIQMAPRGLIVDRFGKPLVKNEPSVDVFLVPNRLPKDSNQRMEIFKNLSLLLGINLETLTNKIKEYDWTVNDRLLLASDISHDQLVDLSSAALPGVEIEPNFKQVEQIAFKFAHLVGYVGPVDKNDLVENPKLSWNDWVGKSGLEKYYDRYLRGVDGKKIFIKNAQGETQGLQIVNAVQPGKELQTFIDADFQEYFYDRLEQALKELGRKSAVGLALNPQNGEVLALINIPSFESAHLAEALNNPANPFFNRAIQGLYNPGSTIKPLVAAAALKEKVIDPNKNIFSAGYLDLPNPYDVKRPTRFLDWRPNGWVNVVSALAKSSNVYFYEVGGGFENQPGLGINRLKKWWQEFNLDQLTGIDLPAEERGFLPDPQEKEKNAHQPWLLGDTYHVSIGQGDLAVTPIGLLNYISAIANGGRIYQPRIMKAIIDNSSSTIKESRAVVLKDLSESLKDVLPWVQKGMVEAVRNPEGTAHLLADSAIPIAAKTGTAQIEANAKINAFFVGYAPVNNPQIAILILIENAREGSLNTVPVARDVLNWYYQHRLKGNKN